MSPEGHPPTTPLARRLAALVAATGPMTVADYMAEAVAAYYAGRDPFGPSGDFVTAPEVSQMFGEILGAWVAERWLALGRPAPVRLVELGPGRGTLMADMLRVARRLPGLREAASVHLVETSPSLRLRQRAAVAPSGFDVAWHDGFDAVPAGPVILVANEFFDALPIRQLVRAGGEWRERLVGLDDGGALAFGLGAAVALGGPEGVEEGTVVELSPACVAVMEAIAGRVAAEGGAALVIDYGRDRPGPGDTLQALKGHRPVHPLAWPGEADVTAHVDFPALARAAVRVGAHAHGPIGQGAFLRALGLAERASRLVAAGAEASEIAAAVDRLAGDAAMGRLFKVLAVTAGAQPPPPFTDV